MLNAGDTICDLSVPDDTGAPRRLRDLAGDWLVVYFFPKDFTSG